MGSIVQSERMDPHVSLCVVQAVRYSSVHATGSEDGSSSVHGTGSEDGSSSVHGTGIEV